MLGGRLARPALDRLGRDLDGGTAFAANQMVMMMRGVAGAKQLLTVRVEVHIGLPVFGQARQRAIDRRDTDLRALICHVVKQLLCTDECTDFTEGFANRGLLPGGSALGLGGHGCCSLLRWLTVRPDGASIVAPCHSSRHPESAVFACQITPLRAHHPPPEYGTIALGMAPATLWAYLPIAAAMGLTNPPILPIVRSIYPTLVPAGMSSQVFSLDSVAQEFIWVVGPVLVTLCVPLMGSLFTLVLIAGIGALGGVLLFTAGEMRTARFTASDKRLGGVLLKWPVLIAVLTATLQNMSYGAAETAVVGVFHGDELEAGLVLAVFALGSMSGGLLTARLPMRPWSMASRQVILALGTIAAAAISTVWWMGACLFLAGFGTASSLAVVYNVVSSSLKAADAAEAFGWLSSGLLGGIAVGSAIAGSVIDVAGPVIALLVSGLLAVCAVILPALGVRVLPDLAISSGPRLDTTAIPVIRRPKP